MMTNERTCEGGFVERRKHKRFHFKGHAYAFNEIDFDQIIDISMGGVAILSGSRTEWKKEAQDVHIVVSDEEFSFKGMQMKKISHSRLYYEKPLKASTADRCSIMFTNLSDKHKGRLEDIIRKYGSDEK